MCEPGAFRAELGGCAGQPAVTTTFDLTGDVAPHPVKDLVATVATVTTVA